MVITTEWVNCIVKTETKALKFVMLVNAVHVWHACSIIDTSPKPITTSPLNSIWLNGSQNLSNVFSRITGDDNSHLLKFLCTDRVAFMPYSRLNIILMPSAPLVGNRSLIFSTDGLIVSGVWFCLRVDSKPQPSSHLRYVFTLWEVQKPRDNHSTKLTLNHTGLCHSILWEVQQLLYLQC